MLLLYNLNRCLLVREIHMGGFIVGEFRCTTLYNSFDRVPILRGNGIGKNRLLWGNLTENQLQRISQKITRIISGA